MLTPRPKTNPKLISLQLSPDEAELLEVVLDGVQGESDTSPEYRETAFLLRVQLDGVRDAARSIAPPNDGSGLYDRVKCPQCLGTGGPSAGPVCELCKGAGTVNAVIVEQMARMSAS